MTKVSLSTAELRLFKQVDADRYVAHFAPYKHYPIFFHGPTEEAVREAAERFRAGVKKPVTDDMDDLLA